MPEWIAAHAPLLCLLLACSLCGCGVQQNSGTAAAPIASALGPQLGYIWSGGERTLRPILGIPGAAQIGQSVVAAGYYVNAASIGSLALLEEPSGFDLMALPSGSPVHLSVPAPGTATAQIRLSPSGASALLFVPGSTALTLVTGLSPVTPPGVNQVQSLTASAPVQDAAVSDAGSAALILREPAAISLAIVGASGKAAQLSTLGANGGLQFLAGVDDLLVADAAANTLSLIRNASTQPAVSLMPTASLLKSPTAVAASRSGRWAVVANGGEASIVRVDLTGLAAPQRATVAAQPTLAAALANDGYFRVTGPPASTGTPSTPTWLVDATAAAPRVLFIPALTASSAGISAPASTHAAAGVRGTASVNLAVQP